MTLRGALTGITPLEYKGENESNSKDAKWAHHFITLNFGYKIGKKNMLDFKYSEFFMHPK